MKVSTPCCLAERSGEVNTVDELSLHSGHGGDGENFPMRVMSLISRLPSHQNDTSHKFQAFERWSLVAVLRYRSFPAVDGRAPALSTCQQSNLGRCVPFRLTLFSPLVLGRRPREIVRCDRVATSQGSALMTSAWVLVWSGLRNRMAPSTKNDEGKIVRSRPLLASP